MFDFSRTINNTFASNYPIKMILKSGQFDNGLYAQISKTEGEISGSCMNMSGKDLKLLPENFRFEFSRQLFTTLEVPLDCDIEYRSKRYKVILSEPYDDISDSGHWKSILKLYSTGYNNAGQDTIRDPETVPPTTPPESPLNPLPEPTGSYINGVWTNG